jgi:mRNA interferase RelE/StbE
VLEQLEQTFARDPHAGIPLAGEFRGLFKLRVGDDRVIYTKLAEGVLVLRIGHRKDVYR